MKYRAVHLALLLALAGCHQPTKPEDVRVPETASVIANAQFTESTVMGSLADVRDGLAGAVTASIGLPSESAVRAAASAVEGSLAKVEAAVAAHPFEEVKQVIQDLLKAIDEFKAIVVQRDAEIAHLKDADARFWNRVLVGLGIACALGAVANLFLAAQVPLFGPRIAALLGACSVTSFLLAYLAAWARDNPVKTAVAVVSFIAVAAGLAIGNYISHKEEKKA